MRENTEGIWQRELTGQVAPPEAGGKIEVVITAIEDEIFAREQPGPADIAKPDGGSRESRRSRVSSLNLRSKDLSLNDWDYPARKADY